MAYVSIFSSGHVICLFTSPKWVLPLKQTFQLFLNVYEAFNPIKWVLLSTSIPLWWVPLIWFGGRPTGIYEWINALQFSSCLIVTTRESLIGHSMWALPHYTKMGHFSSSFWGTAGPGWVLNLRPSVPMALNIRTIRPPRNQSTASRQAAKA